MTRSAANLRVAPTTSGQHGSDDFELRRERIQSAFASIEESTAPTGNSNAEAIAVKLNSSPAPQRGVRLVPPPSPNRLIGFVTEHRWQGHILSVDTNGKFWARVYDMSQENSNEVEEAQFDLEDVPDLMKDLVRPGGIFFWDIGFQVEPSGRRVRQSLLSFPMIPRVTAKEQQAARERALSRFASLGWDQPQAPDPLRQAVLTEILGSLKAAAVAQPAGGRPSQRFLGAILTAFRAATAKPPRTLLDAIFDWLKDVAKQPPAPPPQGLLALILEEAAASRQDPLVIVDLTMPLGSELGVAARKELAEELGYTGDPDDFASMNAWVHEQMMARLSANGRKLPPEMQH
jgi:hypothetical protein